MKKHRSLCKTLNCLGRRDCKACIALYMRQWRAKHPLTLEQKARKMVYVYLNRGKVTKQPCPCGSTYTNFYHPDPTLSLSIVWLCSVCLLKSNLPRGEVLHNRLSELLSPLWIYLLPLTSNVAGGQVMIFRRIWHEDRRELQYQLLNISWELQTWIMRN